MGGQESWWLAIRRFATLVVGALLLVTALVAAVTSFDGTFEIRAVAFGLFISAGLVAAGYLFVILGFMGDVSDFSRVNAIQFLVTPLDIEARASLERADQMREVSLFVFALIGGQCGLGVLLLWVT